MSYQKIVWVLAVMASAASAFGFSSDGSSVTRTFSAGLALTNAPVVVTVTFTNAQTNALWGWFYSDQVPDGLSLSTLSVKVNGQSVTNYLLESGNVGDVYPGCRPWRWVLEEPPAFTEANAIAASGTVEIVYAVSAAVPGSFAMQQYSWAAWAPVATNACFGHSETADEQTLAYIDVPAAPRLGFLSSAEGFTLSMDGVSGARYCIEASTNLVDWVGLVTNTSSISFVDTNRTFPQRFYRAVWP